MGRANILYKRSVRLGWIIIFFVLTLFFFYQLFFHLAPGALCGSHVSCDHAARVVNRLIFYGMILSLMLFLPNSLKLSAFAALFALVIVEAGYRINDSYLDYRYPRDQEEGGSVLSTYDPTLGWKMNPNIETVFSSRTNRIKIPVKTNSKGLRDEEYGYAKPQGVKRILLLGDSVVAGMEVEADQVLDKRLEALLSRNGKYEVINAGVRGYGTDQSYLFLRNEGYKYNPDIIIYVFVTNDPWENVTAHKPGRKFGKGYFKRVNGDLVLAGVPVPRKFVPGDKWLMSDPAVEEAYNKAEASEKNDQQSLSFAGTVRDEISRFHSIDHVLNSLEFGSLRTYLVARGLLDLPAGDRYGGWPFQGPPPQFTQDYEWDIMEGLLSKMNRFSDSIHAKFVVYESSPTGMHKSPQTRLEIISKKLGIRYFNSFEEMYAASNGTKFRFPSDVHWNAEGHNFVASAMYKYLLQDGLVQ